ncbi:MAG TPA: UDP-glucose 4-epimerase GalE [Chthonomonadales bacterium]|nr:UDP-glucose 4-epimerase GalE [Chthonomonadales bacterium]
MILVTGGAGYIGSHYVLYERSRGGEVIVLDNLVYGHREAVQGVPLIVGDVGDRELLDRLFCHYPIEAVVHFAAFAYVGESVKQPERYFHNNVVSTLTLLEAMRAHHICYLVFSSSCATYGNPKYVPLDEHHPQDPINPYGESKRFCERMMAAYDHAHGLRFIALRYFNAAGADPQGRIGESHEPETHLIPLILQVATGRREALTIYGTDYDTPDGTCIRDYIHIMDLAQAHALALDRLRAGCESAYYNLGTENGHSVREVIAVCEKVTGKPMQVTEGLRRPGDPPCLVASAARAKAELGWQPRFTDLEEIVTTAWNWEQKRPW